jgi:hypothetical protein
MTVMQNLRPKKLRLNLKHRLLRNPLHPRLK